MAAYVVGFYTMWDHSFRKSYGDQTVKLVEKHGGRFLVRPACAWDPRGRRVLPRYGRPRGKRTRWQAGSQAAPRAEPQVRFRARRGSTGVGPRGSLLPPAALTAIPTISNNRRPLIHHAV
jgi:hypothetical protein